MTTLFDATRPVKTARRPFATGLVAALMTHRADHTAADEAWLVEALDRLADEARALDLLCLGLVAA